jgi:hypothetical protein
MDEPEDTYPYGPEITGRLWITAHLEEANRIGVGICGDPEGLRSLGEKLIFLANADQRTRRVPEGERDHMHLVPKSDLGFGGQLGATSCRVELCRADACGTGEIYPHLEEADRDAFGFEPDSVAPTEWFDRAAASLQLADLTAAGSALQRQQVPILVSQSVFCSLMAGLRALQVVIPDLLGSPTQLTVFIPDEVALPVALDDLSDLLFAEVPVPALTCNPLPTDDEIDHALDAGSKMLAWAEETVGTNGPTEASPAPGH